MKQPSFKAGCVTSKTSRSHGIKAEDRLPVRPLSKAPTMAMAPTTIKQTRHHETLGNAAAF